MFPQTAQILYRKLLPLIFALLFYCFVLWNYWDYIFADSQECWPVDISADGKNHSRTIFVKNSSFCQIKQFDENIRTVKDCLKSLTHTTKRKQARITFVGDSRMRQLHFGIYNQLEEHPSIPVNRHQDFRYVVGNLNFAADFLWAPFLDNEGMVNYFTQIAKQSYEESPDIIIVNSGAWTLTECGAKRHIVALCIDEYRKNITTMAKHLQRLTKHSKVIWTLQNSHQLRQHLTKRHLTTTNVRHLNRIAQHALKGTGVQIWKSYYQIFEWFNDTEDGLHLGNQALQVDMQIIFDSVCNGYDGWEAPFCCEARPVEKPDIYLIVFVAACLYFMLMFGFCHRIKK